MASPNALASVRGKEPDAPRLRIESAPPVWKLQEIDQDSPSDTGIGLEKMEWTFVEWMRLSTMLAAVGVMETHLIKLPSCMKKKLWADAGNDSLEPPPNLPHLCG